MINDKQHIHLDIFTDENFLGFGYLASTTLLNMITIQRHIVCDFERMMKISPRICRLKTRQDHTGSGDYFTVLLLLTLDFSQ